MAKPLTVYKASAGSGKTFTLAVEYIKLLVQNPNNFRNILAVTFTNKATEEMKMRIVSQMYGIWKGYDDSKSYIEKLCSDLQCSEDFLRGRIGVALHLLLHNYSFFRVETIDSFFQSVLRNLARELDLTANLRIELNDRQVEELAVDRMIDDLKSDDDVMRWIMDYIYDNMQEDKTWNVIGQIKSFGATIFKDYYKDHHTTLAAAMSKPDFFADYVKSLKEKRDKAQNAAIEVSRTFFDTIEAAQLSLNDFPYGAKGLVSIFIKIKDGPIPPSAIGKRSIDAVDNLNSWVKKSDKRASAIRDIVEGELNPLLKYAVENMPNLWKDYQSSQLSLRHLYQLRLLDAIETKVRSLNEEAGRFLLSDTQHLLQSLISDNDSPFIFEKIGSYLEYIMIDEFQDTSVVQWKNFNVLLQECMSHANSENLIVGDVKQSIYRWRSGDWRLLNDIDRQFPGCQQQVCIKPLRVNYRSNGNVIDFNNTFFVNASRLEYEVQKQVNEEEAQQLAKAYSDVAQQIPDGRKGKGMVSVALLPSADYQEAALDETAETARNLVLAGVPQSDIAILVRTNNLIPVIANYFADNCPEICIVSDEAYRLDSSPAVKIIVEALRLLTHPTDTLSLHALVYLYQTTCLGVENNLNGIFLQSKDIWSLLPSEYASEKESLLLMPLYDLVERICLIFNVNAIKGQTAYVSTFLDFLADFTTSVTSDIDSFLSEWETSICQKTICGDKVDGIRILSIHKSKGLEFNNVIVPFCDWKLEKSIGNMIWCSPDVEPYNQLPLLPVDYNRKSLMDTIFEKDYLHESFQNTVDNLNLLYVAFTRASRNLFVIGKRGASGSRSALIEQCLPLVAEQLESSTIEGMENNDATIRFTFGAPDTAKPKDKTTENVLLSGSQPVPVTTMQHESDVVFRQSNMSREFIEGDDNESLGYIKTGSLLHNVLSRIRTIADIDIVVNEMEMEGLIDRTEISKERILSMLHKRLADSRVCQWFTSGWKLYNECTLLHFDHTTGELTERRPDRVITNGNRTIVIDFKFGNSHAEYHDQVREYIQQLRTMGHADVTGYLWYVYQNNIEKVEA